ncbi:G/U mismatch-specific uracil DNA glycosylase [Candida viswanathii]|uniref:G/U mismatch-specific uracil DNA glycosylase n=1 Tax=Candida viswanathii TaxID=5486 RepID=A0A367XW89_9ASCO|nr:G/U mismatch-specific uracil DNA glycosylase [Candida viswanathii]
MTNDRLSKLRSFRYEGDAPSSRTSKIVKPPLKTKKNAPTKPHHLPDLRQSLNAHLRVLFIGFNPGVESSVQQHHYAHHSNLFWKLFNQSGLLRKVVAVEGVDVGRDEFLRKLLADGCSATNDFELIAYNVGFTDLVLRCTARADQLSNEEKLQNVPRLLKEFKESDAHNIVVIGKGIWEVIVKYLSKDLDVRVKLNKENFTWGLQSSDGSDENYNLVVESIYKQLSKSTKLYVFPNTSGLVASMTFAEKLSLWTKLVDGIN